MYCIVSTLVVSMVGAYTSDSTPPATVYQILEVVLRAVPRQSLRARSKWLGAPGPSVAAASALAGAIGTNIVAATVAAAAMSTVAVLLFISMAHSQRPSTVTTVTNCPSTSSRLPELSIRSDSVRFKGGCQAVPGHWCETCQAEEDPQDDR